MDVSLSVSLLRDQMGTVIEQAVTAAVETVLGEMVKVVGCKLEECSKEMTAKEKENESIRQMLEISQCQMKTMRKYLSAVIAKDERQVLVGQRNAQKHNESNRTHRLPVGQMQHFRGMKRTVKGVDGTSTSAKAKKPLTQSTSAYPSELGLVQTASSCDRLPTKSPSPHELAQESTPRLTSEDSFDDTILCISREASELAHMKEESRGCPEVVSEIEGREEVSEPAWGTSQQSASEEECIENLDSSPESPVKTVTAEPSEASGSSVWDVPVRAKEEEAEIEIICIKEEPEELEPYSLDPPCSNLGVEQGSPPERVRPLDAEHADELTEASLAAVTPPFMYPDAHRQQTVAQRQARWRHRMRDQSLYEDHKHRKAELKRRSQHRRREREKSLPQPLLAALERERREKNRIRVARWRAKRKLQAGLVTSPPAQFGYPPAQTAAAQALPQHNDKLHCHPPYSAVPQPGALLFNSPPCESGSLFSSLQFNSSPLMSGLRHDT
ncbi:hypothetical protein SKAU_G00242250 [Synaphobranchus kaupii]|uniref:Uncharacterized protein n=1 Tax=Synaphobranchus kaupii TaxID=118154 RepID=A0A9Q1IUC4_SYNKA|nr:hypothetical protein SKAU_G00242250 [Synaphobranchus kaupii]